MAYQRAFRFSKETFARLELPDLLINVWSWGTPHDGCVVCTQYRDWCVELVRERWLPYYIDFDIFIKKLKKNDKEFEIFGKICSEEQNKIYDIIKRDRYDDGWDN